MLSFFSGYFDSQVLQGVLWKNRHFTEKGVYYDSKRNM